MNDLRMSSPNVSVGDPSLFLWIPRLQPRGMTIFGVLVLLPLAWSWAKPQANVRNELPAPYNLQAVVLKNAVTLTWQWPRPEALPVFLEFGYEIKRQDGKTFLAPNTTYLDEKLAPG